MKPIKAVLFDLDGTLLDTAPDLALTLNIMLEKYQCAAIPFEKIRPLALKGTTGLLQLGFNLKSTDKNYPAMRAEFLELYEHNIKKHTQFFPGIENVIQFLEKNNICWGIVTNKPEHLTRKLLNYFEISKCACIVAGDTLTKQKPNPEPLWHACTLVNCPIENSIYVGDDHRDIIAAKKANLISVAALYGYIQVDENPFDWEADYYIETPMEILDLI